MHENEATPYEAENEVEAVKFGRPGLEDLTSLLYTQ